MLTAAARLLLPAVRLLHAAADARGARARSGRGIQPHPVHRWCSCARAALLPIYWWLVGRTPRGRLPWLVCTPFVLVFLALAVGTALVSGRSDASPSCTSSRSPRPISTSSRCSGARWRMSGVRTSPSASSVTWRRAAARARSSGRDSSRAWCTNSGRRRSSSSPARSSWAPALLTSLARRSLRRAPDGERGSRRRDPGRRPRHRRPHAPGHAHPIYWASPASSSPGRPSARSCTTSRASYVRARLRRARRSRGAVRAHGVLRQRAVRSCSRRAW